MEATDKDITDLILNYIMKKEIVNILIDAWKIPLQINKEKVESLKNECLNHFSSEEFLLRFTKPFKSIFSQEDITYLLDIYNSEPMKKHLKHGKSLFDPVYKDMLQYLTDSCIPFVDEKFEDKSV